jgi:putative membrane protein
MFTEILVAIFVGVSCGIVTGLTPGVHINLVAAMLLSFSAFLLRHINPIALAVFVIAMSVTHTFLDNIPSIFLGAPEEANALGVLPGHRYLLKGYGLMAVKLTLVGSFGALVLSIALFPLFILIVRFGYPIIQSYMGYLLIATVGFMLWHETKRLWAFFIFLISGLLGLVTFNIPNFANPLFPMLSGMFGIATLIISLKDENRIPSQKYEQRIKIRRKTAISAILLGQFSGFITAVLPGLSASIAAVMSQQVDRKLGDHGFMVLIGSIGTVNFLLSMAALSVLDKARNGSIIAVRQLVGKVNTPLLLVFLCSALVAGGISVYLVLRIGRLFSVMITRVNYRKLVSGIILFVASLVAITTGLVGLLVLLVSTAIGILPAMARVSRTHAMGCIMVPVILYFL